VGDDDACRGDEEQAGPIGLHDLSVGGGRGRLEVSSVTRRQQR
jgi:hypothetical protein